MYGFNKVPTLSKGRHDTPEEGMCIMELVSFINREPFSDTPRCTDSRIALYMQTVNDTVTDEERPKLLSVLDRMFHTGSMTLESYMGFNNELVKIWPELVELLENRTIRARYAAAVPATSFMVWHHLCDLSGGLESADVKLAILNKVLDVMDEAMGVEETLPQNRGEIEKMLVEREKLVYASNNPWNEE